MTPDDHLAVLGLEPGASPEQIKSAYRRVARDNHPDRNPGDPEAAERFRRAADAYRALGAREQGPRSKTPTGARTTSEVFHEVFGRRPTHKRERGADLRYTLRLSFLEAARGGERVIRVPSQETCRRCGGTGAEPGSSPVLCPECHGQGTRPRRIGFFEVRDPCPTCQGRGRLQTDPCRACSGLGEVTVDREIPIPLAAGVVAGTRLRVAGEGQRGVGGAENGDLFVVIDVESHPLFTRDERDLVIEVPIPFTVAAFGGHVRVPTLDGVVRMRVPPGSQSGRVFRLKGKGFDGGDQRVILRIEVPESGSEEARRALDAYARIEEHEQLLPRVRGFHEAVAIFERDIDK